ncbi:MAG: YtxH domain-containing protein, partial [Actinobacteria bacterium]|nr:YtxH domain-containing protein [Actinomycetota bacterium]
MKRFMKIVLGLSIGAAVAVLFAPKSGRKLREQLIGGATGRLLPAAPVEFPEPAGERLWEAGAATAVAEPPVVVDVASEAAVAEPPVTEEAIAVVEEVTVDEVTAVEPEMTEDAVAEPEMTEDGAAAEPVVAEAATSEDLRERIDETRAAIEADIAHPFAP